MVDGFEGFLTIGMFALDMRSCDEGNRMSDGVVIYVKGARMRSYPSFSQLN